MTDREPEEGPGERPGPPPSDGDARPEGAAHGESPGGTSPEPGPGEASEGPSGLGQAGFEHAGYAPGYGETDLPAAGAGSHPGGPPPPGAPTPPPGTYGPPPPAPTPWGKVVGIGCAVLLFVLLLMGGCTALLLVTAGGNGESAQEVADPEADAPSEPVEEEITAVETEFEPSSLYTEGEFTSVKVSVTNTGEEDIDVNPLYFSVVDAQGRTHGVGDAIALDENELEAGSVAPGETVTGTVTVPGEVEAATLVFDPFYHEAVEVPVEEP
ncbi:DUF4352 domain-containing protein [Nocardiopsis sp. CNT312]|uniref:DUF4352 domain-containing protein n=1 Tax=Nocardiopsis sp. CNT312 TaxID=1137268 RepID=UPI0004ADE704|nr:DUF4352 domain-containing protein [Nocardiopsis sp. CNT312]